MNNGRYPVSSYRQHIRRDQPNSILAQMVTIPEAAKQCGVSEYVIRYQIRKGTLPAYRNNGSGKGRAWLIKRKDLQAAMKLSNSEDDT